MEEPLEAQVQQPLHHSSMYESVNLMLYLNILVCFVGLAEDKQNQFLKDAILALQDHFVKDWYTLGLHLGLHVKDLNVIESNSLSYVDKRTCVRQILTIWKDKFDREATWEKIVIALRKTGNNSLAREVEEQLIQQEKQALKEKGKTFYYFVKNLH